MTDSKTKIDINTNSTHSNIFRAIYEILPTRRDFIELQLLTETNIDVNTYMYIKANIFINTNIFYN